MHKLALLAFIAAPLCRAFQFPFDISNVWSMKHQFPLSPPDVVPPRSPRIAIIGAGAGGSSAAFWIAKAKERYGLDIAIDIYERSDYVGGRSTTAHPYNNTAYEPVELGASIFVEVNKNLWRAVNEFNLSLKNPGFGDQAIWDGEQILLTLEESSSWFPMDKIKFLWRYGYHSPKRTQELVRTMVNKMIKLYEPDTPHWSSIEELNEAFNWTGQVSQTGAKLLQSHGVSQRFTYEIIESLSRCNYAQNVDRIHGLETLVSFAGDGKGVRSVKGGNWRIFEQFVERSGARVFLNTEVVGIERHSKDIWTVVTKDERRDYGAVVIAAPYHTSHISMPTDLSSLIPPQPHIHLHVTLLTTTAPMPNPMYFGHKSGSKVPTFILTTFDGARRGGRAPEFNSLSYMGQTKFAKNETHDKQETGEWIVKIFSMEHISDEWLSTMFQNQVGWVLRKEWDSYPVLPPTTSFPPLKLDDGLFYVNAFEPFISTMETETIASRNVVDLLLQEKFNSSICHLDKEKRGKEVPEGFVYGWDC